MVNEETVSAPSAPTSWALPASASVPATQPRLEENEEDEKTTEGLERHRLVGGSDGTIRTAGLSPTQSFDGECIFCSSNLGTSSLGAGHDGEVAAHDVPDPEPYESVGDSVRFPGDDEEKHAR